MYVLDMIELSDQNISLEKCPALVLNADYRPLSYYPFVMELAGLDKICFFRKSYNS